MKKTSIITALLLTLSLPLLGQGVVDALPNISSQLKGTARYTSMGGAFGALGGEITSIRHNPAGIGIYRTSEVSVTSSFNFYDNKVQSRSNSSINRDFQFSSDNFGVVGVINFKSGALRNLNFGFAYNNTANFKNVYRAEWQNISSSITNAMVQSALDYNMLPSDLLITNNHNPYNPDPYTYQSIYIPWLAALGYNNNMFSQGSNPNSRYESIFRNNSTGSAYIENHYSGNIEEYDFNVSGNIFDKFYWGVTLNVSNITYKLNSYHGEALNNVVIKDNRNTNSRETVADGGLELRNALNTTGNGVGVKLGLLYRPIDFLRIGIAVHSPTYYNMTDSYYADIAYQFKGRDGSIYSGDGEHSDNQTDLGYYNYQYSSPWHYLASLAFVIGKSAIISFDYELVETGSMYYNDIYGSYTNTNADISSETRPIHNLRAGAEYRITPQVSLRAGYAYESSPMAQEYYNGNKTFLSGSTLLNYHIPGDVHNISCGVGYRMNNFYVDAAYVYRTQNYRIFPIVPDNITYGTTDMLQNCHSLKITLGYRF